MKKLILVSLLHSVLFSSFSQESELTLERIFTNREFSITYMGSLRWFEQGAAYTTLEKSEQYPDHYDIVKNITTTGQQEVLVFAEWLIPSGNDLPLEIEDYHWSKDQTKILIYTNSKKVWRRNTKGDYWLLDIQTKELKKLGGAKAKPSTLMFAKLSPDGTQVAYVREHNLYVESLTDGGITSLTTDGSERIINGTFDWAYEEEFSCRDGFSWSPDGKHIAYWKIDATSIRNFYMINNTDSAYSHLIPVQYPKAGQTPSACKVGVASISSGQTVWMDVKGDPRNNYIPRMIWHPNSKEILVQQLNRAQNHNKVIRANIEDGSAEVVYEDKETAWLEVVDDFQYLNEGESFSWVSEKSGWKSAYSVDKDGEQLITPKDQDMLSISLIDEKSGWLYFIASPENPTQKYLYRTRLNGKGKATRLTPLNMPGTHSYQISPNGKYARHTYSRAGTPPVIDLVELPSHKVVRTFVDNKETRRKLSALKKNPVEFFSVTTDEGLEMDAFMIKPVDFDPNKKYPVLFYVYGEPWSQTVTDAWGGSNYLWHLMLSQQGYVIMSVDNRGTPAPKGREWRKSVYGQIGYLSSQDQAAALRLIIDKYDFVDPDRIGIWGWSGGGAMTLNMLFRYPELYHTGMSVAPVTDQRLYDNIYQERYSGIPSLMPESYEKGSPIHYAKNLKGNLLLVHGTGDDNVHYQHSELLINELIRHNKIFSFMPYPNRSHGIFEGENTSRHLREILTNYLKANLPTND